MIKKILVAEDNPLNYIVIKKLLESMSKNPIIHAVNGKEAVEYCKSHSDLGLVLMDIKMPIMDGYEATRKIKKRNPSLPVVAQTAFAETESRQAALDAGCDEYITKPIQISILQHILNTFLS